MVPTYATKGSRRYAYYETRKDLARPKDPPATRVRQSQLDRHIIVQLTALLKDQHALRRLSQSIEANELSSMFETGRELAGRLVIGELRQPTIAKLLVSIHFADGRLDIALNPRALGIEAANPWHWNISAPPSKPFRETKLRIDPADQQAEPDPQLIKLLVDAKEVQELVLGSPELSLNQLGKREGRCRTQLAKYLRLSWLSPRVVEAILTGNQPRGLKRTLLLKCDLPIDWRAQEQLFGFAA